MLRRAFSPLPNSARQGHLILAIDLFRDQQASMVSSDSWKVLKDRATFVSHRHEFLEVDTVLDD